MRGWRNRRRRGVAGLEEPGAQDDGGAAAVAQGGLDELDGAPRASDGDGGVDLADGEGAEDVEGQAREGEGVPGALGAALVAVGLDDVREQTEGWRDVLLVEGPGAAGVLGGAERGGAGAIEVGHGVDLDARRWVGVSRRWCYRRVGQVRRRGSAG